MEDKEEYNKAEEDQGQDASDKEPEEVRRCLACGQPHEPKEIEEGQAPPSVLIIKFASPGSAQIVRMQSEGMVTPEQLGAAGLFLQTRAQQEWTLPIMQMVVENVIEDFMKEVSKPRIATPGNMPPTFFMPSQEKKPL